MAVITDSGRNVKDDNMSRIWWGTEYLHFENVSLQLVSSLEYKN